MVYSSAVLTAREVALAAADKPILGVHKGLAGFSAVEWRDTGDFTSGSDQTDSDFPTRNAYDGKSHLQTAHTNSVATTYLIFDTGLGNEIEFDFITLMNRSSTSAISSLIVNISDNSDFSGAVTIADLTGTGTSDPRFIDTTLTHLGGAALRYSNVRFIAIEFTIAGPGINSVGEIVFGRRHQLGFKGNIPFDNESRGADSSTAVSRSGVRTRFTRSRGRFDLNYQSNPSKSEDKQPVLDWFDDIDQGVEPFVYIEDPDTSPEDWRLMMLTEPTRSYPLQGPFERSVSIEAQEQGPSFLALEA